MLVQARKFNLERANLRPNLIKKGWTKNRPSLPRISLKQYYTILTLALV